ncbi:MAG: acyl-CoA synthetase [Actinobacteria bacterium]|nr:MAG: acyl-CoA synthetase [Actinomycetota bacterium]
MFPGQIATTTPDKPAIIMASTSQVITYQELDDSANRLSQLLYHHGLRSGDHIAICLENHPRFFEVIWGCHYAGLIYTACSSRLTSDELSYIINDCSAKAFITSIHKADQAVEIADSIPRVDLRLMLDGTVAGYDSYEDVVAQQSALPLDDRVDGSDMLYSSGTTGRPKGVALNLGNSPLGSPNGVTSLGQFLFSMNDSTIYLSPAPLYHAAPLRWNLAVHRVGGTTIIMEHFDAQEFLQLIQQYSVTHSQTVPTMFVRLLKLPDDVRKQYDTTSLTHIFHAAAPCPVDIKQQTIEWLGPIVHEYYAGSEGNGFVYCNSEQWLSHPGTVGQSLQGVIHILDDEGNELPVGQIGTIYFESAAKFEYHNDPEKTEASKDILGRGWSTLGDIGYLDDESYLYLTDRKAFMIIAGGVNIYPQEAENVLVSHPDVADVAVFGVPNDEFGEEVKAVVQPTTMPTSEAEAKVLEQKLIAHCRASLASFKCPKSIDFRAELPRHPTGKLYKRLLKDEYWAAAGRSI